MSEDEAVAILASNGNLIKRPFVLSERGDTVGFKIPLWEQLFLSLREMSTSFEHGWLESSIGFLW